MKKILLFLILAMTIFSPIVMAAVQDIQVICDSVHHPYNAPLTAEDTWSGLMRFKYNGEIVILLPATEKIIGLGDTQYTFSTEKQDTVEVMSPQATEGALVQPNDPTNLNKHWTLVCAGTITTHPSEGPKSYVYTITSKVQAISCKVSGNASFDCSSNITGNPW